MNIRRCRVLRVFLATLIILATATWTGRADLRIVEELRSIAGGVVQSAQREFFITQDRGGMIREDGVRTYYYCDTGEVTLVFPPELGLYWQGTLDEFREEAEKLLGVVNALLAELQAMPELKQLFGTMSPQPERSEVGVRVRKLGSGTIAGYTAERYVVETGSGDTWQVYEDVWVSRELFEQIAAIGGECASQTYDLELDVSSLAESTAGAFGMGEIAAIANSSEYVALFEQAHPVRRQSQFTVLFGLTVQSIVEVVEVSTEPIPEEYFQIPPGYTRMESLVDMMPGLPVDGF